jgi:hypothetical protein
MLGFLAKKKEKGKDSRSIVSSYHYFEQLQKKIRA